jgi:methylthioribose-1-phosphate isomerase
MGKISNMSVLDREHGISFYLAAPSSTFDLSIKSGSQIPVEQRPADEVRFLGGGKITPEGVKIYNPAFDVTRVGNISKYARRDSNQSLPFDFAQVRSP